jgi:hypothetical protein
MMYRSVVSHILYYLYAPHNAIMYTLGMHNKTYLSSPVSKFSSSDSYGQNAQIKCPAHLPESTNHLFPAYTLYNCK